MKKPEKFITKSVKTRAENINSDFIYCENGFILSKRSMHGFSLEGWTSKDVYMFDVDAKYLGQDEAGYDYYEYEEG